MNANSPVIGQWYVSRADGCKFSVIDIDEGHGYIELQDEDGYLAEIGTSVWPHIETELTTKSGASAS